MSVWDDLQEVRPEWVTLILSDGERYDAMDTKFADEANWPAFTVSCESWRGAVVKGSSGDDLWLLTHEIWGDGDKTLENKTVPVKVDMTDWLTRSGKAPAKWDPKIPPSERITVTDTDEELLA